jgi:ATP-dependent DNA helicase PIF1
MYAVKDKCIVVPIEETNIHATIESLPRLPSEAGILDVHWKRRISAKNSHLTNRKVIPDKIFNALEFLRTRGNRYYQKIQTREEYEKNCQTYDPEGYQLLFGNTYNGKLILEFQDDISTQTIHDLNEYHQLLQENEEEIKLKKNDVIQKFHYDYGDHICYVEKFPEALQTEGVLKCISKVNKKQQQENQLHIIAPGEGKTPIHLLSCIDYELKAFPILFPDGHNNLTDIKRKKKIRPLMYFEQRLFNKDSRWRFHPHWIFAAALYKENKDLLRNIDLGYKKGIKNTNTQGKSIYTLHDPFSVFQNVANTPTYHKKGKMEMMARLDNFGPFHIFFTLSCADTRWSENITSILQEHGIGLRCLMSNDHKNTYEVQTPTGEWIPIDQYRDEHMDKSMSDLLRTNVVTSTRNYQKRVATFMKTILKHKSNPLCVKHFTSKLEFQARGAGHHHGTLWLDIDRIEQKVDVRELLNNDKDEFDPEDDHHLKDPIQVQNKLDEVIMTMGNTAHNKKTLKYLDKLNSQKKIRELTPEENSHIEKLCRLHPLYGLKKALNNVHKGKPLPTTSDLNIIAKFVDTFNTVSLHPTIVGSTVAAIANEVNKHHHTTTCYKHNTHNCRFNFPKVPSYKTIIAIPPPTDWTPEKKKREYEKKRLLIIKVQEVIKDKEKIEAIMKKYPKTTETNSDQVTEGRQKRIDAVLQIAGEDKQKYCEALAYHPSAYSVIMARDIDEEMVNNYNPEITKAWNGNTDFQICLDFYAIVTYITEYYAKDDTGTIKTLINALKQSNNNDLKAKMKLLHNTWVTNRQMGEAEAVYKLTQHYHFRDSDAACIFLQTCPRSERSKILKNAKDKPEYNHLPKVIPDFDTDGIYIEQYDYNSKYERRPCEKYPILYDLCQAQFVKMYKPYNNKKQNIQEDDNKKEDEEEEDTEEESDNANEEDNSINNSDIKDKDDDKVLIMPKGDKKFKRVMAYGIEVGKGSRLPKKFKLNNPNPAEPPWMQLRSSPAVLRMHKNKEDKNPDEFWYSQATLYLPFTTEDNLNEQIDAAKNNGHEMLNLFRNKIAFVKNQVMEYLEDTDTARTIAEQAEQSIDPSKTGELLDAEGEQDNEDNLLDDIEVASEFAHIDLGNLNTVNEHDFAKEFRPIIARELDILRPEARTLDHYQQKVLEIAINYCRALVKIRHNKNKAPTAPLVMVDGAAGAGKSKTIAIMKEFVQIILQQSGDNLEEPHILICAPTGTAAVNIQGSTLHSGLGFKFGDVYYSLPDQARDQKRRQFQNLKILIIDEISMVKADMLYNIDMRLREITMKNKPFGNIAMFCFGDIMQLPPVQGRSIWCPPKNYDYLTAFMVQSHWEQFTVITLMENHRQEEDKEYANMLNRLRVGEQTNEDISKLYERIIENTHPNMKEALVIASTHAAVNKYNAQKLNLLPGLLYTVEAINNHKVIPYYKPPIDKKKATVGKTSFLQTFNFKINCRLMLVNNLDIADSLCNGSMGTLRGIHRDNNSNIQYLMVEFDLIRTGSELQRQHPHLSVRYPKCTPIGKVNWSYSTGNKNDTGVKNATVYQFPFVLSFATTCHKIQGATIPAPRMVALDLQSIFGPNQAYVMLGRTQSLKQINIIGNFDDTKALKTEKHSLKELQSMKARSLNNNPAVWEKQFENSAKVFFHNIYSLTNKIDDLREDPIQAFADIVILAETWLPHDTDNQNISLHIEGTTLHLNSYGTGKGLAVYTRGNKFTVTEPHINSVHLQMTILHSNNLTVVALYRSKTDKSLVIELFNVIQKEATKAILVIGDFNITSKNHEIFNLLKRENFLLLDNKATHFQGKIFFNCTYIYYLVPTTNKTVHRWTPRPGMVKILMLRDTDRH